jgi:hypothetical protein
MTPATKRRWLRFSLRTLFVVVTVIGVIACAGMYVRYVNDDRARARDHMLEGTLEPDKYRGLGLFTDKEIDAIKAERDRLRERQ